MNRKLLRTQLNPKTYIDFLNVMAREVNTYTGVFNDGEKYTIPLFFTHDPWVKKFQIGLELPATSADGYFFNKMPLYAYAGPSAETENFTMCANLLLSEYLKVYGFSFEDLIHKNSRTKVHLNINLTDLPEYKFDGVRSMALHMFRQYYETNALNVFTDHPRGSTGSSPVKAYGRYALPW